LTGSLASSNFSSGTLTFTWLSGGAEVQSSTSNSYRVQAADVGKRISLHVTSSDNAGTRTVQTAVVARGAGSATSTWDIDKVTYLHNSITIAPDAITIPDNPGTQVLQFAITTNNSNTLPSSGINWQSGPVITHVNPSNASTGLVSNTTYYIWARSAANTACNAGTARRSAAITTAKQAGADVSSAPAVSIAQGSVTHNSITVNPVTVPVNPGNQSVQYAISTESGTLPVTWQNGRTFTGLTHMTTYFVWARTAENNRSFAGEPEVSAPITTGRGTFALSLSGTGVHTFPAAAHGYGEQSAASVTVRNTGNQTAEGLSIFILDTTKFETVPPATETLPDIPVGGSPNLTNRPKTNLDVGTHTTTVYVFGFERDSDGIETTDTYGAYFEVSFTVNRANGATVSTAPKVAPGSAGRTHNTIIVDPVAPGTPGQSVEYAITTATSSTAPVSGWQSSATFTNLQPSTTYRVFARTAANSTHNAGAAKRSDAITTLPAPYDISLGSSGHTFKAAGYKAVPPTALSVKISNTGTEATGAISIAITGTDASSFTLGASTIADIVKGGSQNFTVRPVENLLVGTYSALVTVSGANVPARSFTVSFTVNKGTNPGAPVSGVPIADDGLDPITHNTIRIDSLSVSNGIPATGQGIEYAITDIASTTMPSGLVWQSSNIFTGLKRKTDYYVWARTAANANYNAGVAVRSLSALTTTDPDYDISLSGARVHTFTAATFGYTSYPANRALNVTVTNTGKFATDSLSIEITGPGKDSFTITGTPIGGISTGGAAVFTVLPKTEQGGGLHEAVITVKNDSNSISESLTVRFNVNRLSGSGAAVSGRPEVSAATPSQSSITVNPVTIPAANNTGDQSVEYAITTAKSSTAPKSGWQDSPVFTGLNPSTAYYVWARSAQNNNRNAGPAIRTQSMIRTEGLTLNKTGTHTFKAGSFNATLPPALEVRVTNPGRAGSGALTIALGGTNPGSFELSQTAITGIAAGANATFTVRPRATPVLPVGVYTATVTVSGANTPSRTFNVSFRVNKGAGATVSVPEVDGIPTHSSIKVIPLINPPTPWMQTVEYAISTSNTAPKSGWQSSVEFTNLRQNTNYRVFARSAANADCNAGKAERSAVIKTAAAPYNITLNRDGTHVFAAAQFNYSARKVLSVSVRNTGTQPTGLLNVSIEGADPDSFEIVTPSTGTLQSIARNNTRSFTVRPKQGLEVGEHTATVVVTGKDNNGDTFSTSVKVSFTVNMAVGAAVGQVPTVLSVSRTNITVNPVTIPSNPGKQDVQYALGTNPSATPDSLSWSSSTSFTITSIQPTYYVFARSAASDSHNPGAVRRSAAITVNVPPAYGIRVSHSGTVQLPSAAFGYTTGPALLVTVTNIGTNPTGPLGLFVDNTERFEIISMPESTDIPQHGSLSFIVRPKTGAPVSTHLAGVDITGSNGIFANFYVSFEVTRAIGAAVRSAPVLEARTQSSITVGTVSAAALNPGGQTVLYAISRTTTAPTDPAAWMPGRVFTSLPNTEPLMPSTTYYVFARTAENSTHSAGVPMRSAIIQTSPSTG